MKIRRRLLFSDVLIAGVFATAILLAASSAGGQGLSIPPDARAALDKLYSGDADGSITMARDFQKAHPDHPLGLLLEAEALWWKRYCAALEIKYGMVESWSHTKDAADEAYFALADRAIQLAKDQLAKSESAEMHFYAGMGNALKVRVLGLRNENRAAARAAVAARSDMMRALELDSQMADATAALGLYNYYVDTLSPVVKVLRFFMGIPGGNRELGVTQMKTGMEHGVVLNVDVRFILARALRQYDQKYQEALEIAEPLLARDSQNPMFLLLLGNLNVELGRKAKAAEHFNAVLKLPAVAAASGCCAGCAKCDACAGHTRGLAQEFLSSIH